MQKQNANNKLKCRMPFSLFMKQITFIGGRKTRTVWLGRKSFFPFASGAEGKLYKQNIIVKKGKKIKKCKMVLKKFTGNKFGGYSEVYSNLGEPLKHFETFEELKKLNKEKKLDLPLLSTFRIEKTTSGKPRILMTDLNKKGFLTYDIVNPKLINNYEQIRQQKGEAILKLAENGFDAYYPHNWIVQVNLKTKEGKLFLADLGTIKKINK